MSGYTKNGIKWTDYPKGKMLGLVTAGEMIHDEATGKFTSFKGSAGYQEWVPILAVGVAGQDCKHAANGTGVLRLEFDGSIVFGKQGKPASIKAVGATGGAGVAATNTGNGAMLAVGAVIVGALLWAASKRRTA